MSIPYDLFAESFLDKISEFDFLQIPEEDRNKIIDRYMRKAISTFKNCPYDLISNSDNENRVFNIDIEAPELTDIVNIVSEGMIVEWLKPYVYKQELLENNLNTRDFTTYSSEGLLNRVRSVYESVQKEFKQLKYDYSYAVGKLGDLHL